MKMGSQIAHDYRLRSLYYSVISVTEQNPNLKLLNDFHNIPNIMLSLSLYYYLFFFVLLLQ